jgi:septal ring factor EnvC (AmiA/AmiB activator)
MDRPRNLVLFIVGALGAISLCVGLYLAWETSSSAAPPPLPTTKNESAKVVETLGKVDEEISELSRRAERLVSKRDSLAIQLQATKAKFDRLKSDSKQTNEAIAALNELKSWRQAFEYACNELRQVNGELQEKRSLKSYIMAAHRYFLRRTGVALLSIGVGIVSALIRSLFKKITPTQALAGAPAALGLLYIWNVIGGDARDVLPVICVSAVGGFCLVEAMSSLDRYVRGRK